MEINHLQQQDLRNLDLFRISLGVRVADKGIRPFYILRDLMMKLLLLMAFVFISPQLSNAQDMLSDGARAQKKILQAQNAEKLRQVSVESIKEQLHEADAQYTISLYYAAKSAGIRMAPVEPAIEQINMGRRNSGVWELTISEQLDGPYLVEVNDFGTKTPEFNVDGKGLYGADGYVRDPNFERTGAFSKNCKYEVYIGQQSRLYPCAAYLHGDLNKQVMLDLKEMLVASIKTQPD